MANLPQGFTLDSPISSGLPQGFTLDALGIDQAATPVEDDFIPTEENLALHGTPKKDRTLSENLIGAGEAALSLATGATGGALGFLEGSVRGIAGDIFGELTPEQAQEEAQKFASLTTFQPRTEAGKEFTGNIAEAFSVLPPVVGTTPLNTLKPLVTGKAITDKILKNPRAKRALLADEIKKGNPNIELVTKTLNESGDIITNQTSKRAVKLLGGDHTAQGTVAVIENMSPASKNVLRKQLHNISKGRNEPLFGDANRPSNMLGESILDRAVAINKVNDKAGKTIGRTADTLKDINVDISGSNNAFLSGLNKLGVTFTRGDDGWVTPDFSRSKFDGGNQQKMTVLINDLFDGAPSFDVAHKLKRTIRDNIDFESGAGGIGQVKGDSRQLLINLSSGIDDVLDSTSPQYKKANESFAKTIKLKNDFDKLMGKDIDLNDKVSASAILGNKAMRVDSNAPSGVVINKLFNDADNVLGEFKIRFKDDIPSLRHITNKLNEAFKIAPPNSLKGNIVSGGIDVAEAATGNPIAVARMAAKAAKKDAPDFNKKMRAFKSLVSQQQDK